MTYCFETDCINSTYDLITTMVETARHVTYRTFIRHVSTLELNVLFPYYASTKRQGLTLKNDWAVSFWKSSYNGRPCYYVEHSHIEYIFTKQD